MTIIVNIVDQKTGQDDRDDNEYCPAIFKKTKSNTRIMDKLKMKDIGNERDRLIQIQKTGEKILGQAVKKDDG